MCLHTREDPAHVRKLAFAGGGSFSPGGFYAELPEAEKAMTRGARPLSPRPPASGFIYTTNEPPVNRHRLLDACLARATHYGDCRRLLRILTRPPARQPRSTNSMMLPSGSLTIAIRISRKTCVSGTVNSTPFSSSTVHTPLRSRITKLT